MSPEAEAARNRSARSQKADLGPADGRLERIGARTIPELVQEHAQRTPNAVALAAPGRVPLAFDALDRHIGSIADALRANGVGSGSRIAVMLPNGPELASACLAIASCATCVPLNPATSPAQLKSLLADLQAAALVLPQDASPSTRAIADGLGVRIIDLAADPRAAAGLFTLPGYDGSARQSVPPRTEADDVALVLHTSGTTARPKQVPLTHANLCASAQQIAATLQLSGQDRCLNVLPLFHIHGLAAALLASLSVGASVACTPGLAHGDFFDWLEALQPTWYTAVPTMHQAILAAAGERRDAIRRAPLRFVRSASAPLSGRLAQRLEQCFGAPVIEAYGMTEAAHQIASNPLPPDERKLGSVGRPAGTEVAVMDGEGRLLAPGVRGEIVIRGRNVTAGYASNPEANRAAFKAGWFHTGDQGYVDADGYVFLTGRLKDIVNRGGEKLALQEVDAALLEHPAVAQAAAFAVAHATLGEDVAAAIVLAPDAAASAAEIRAFLLDRLPRHAVPSEIVIVEQIPAGATGKIDRSLLGALFAQRSKPAFVAPRDPIEAQVAEIFAAVTGAASVGANDSLFALGGDSLQGFRVLTRIRSTLGVSLSIVDLFKMPTVAQVARAVAEARSDADALALDRILREIEASRGEAEP